MVKNVIPQAPKGHILLTSRTPIWGKLAQPVDIDLMKDEEGAFFLLQRINILKQDTQQNSVSDTDYNNAKKISQIMAGLPLALEQAGAYIDEMGCGLAEYIDLYQNQQTTLLKWQSNLDSDQTKSVATTWSLSFEQIEQTNPQAADLLRFFAFLHPDAIPEEIITIGSPHLSTNIRSIATNPLELNLAIRDLRRYSLVHRTPDSQTLSIHRLEQVILKERMNTETQQKWAERTVKAVNQVFPRVEFNTWVECQQYLPHALICVDLIEQWEMRFAEAARLLNVAGYYLYQRANYNEAELLLHKALTTRKELFETDHPEIAESLNNLAELYRIQAKYLQAVPFCQQALEIRKQLWGIDHYEVALSMNNLARLYQHLGQYYQAEPLYQQALEIRKRTLGLDHPAIAESLNDLATLYSRQGKDVKGIALLLEALEIRRRTLGNNHPDVALSLNNLGITYREQAQYKLAESYHLQALEIRKQALVLQSHF